MTQKTISIDLRRTYMNTIGDADEPEHESALDAHHLAVCATQTLEEALKGAKLPQTCNCINRRLPDGRLLDNQEANPENVEITHEDCGEPAAYLYILVTESWSMREDSSTPFNLGRLVLPVCAKHVGLIEFEDEAAPGSETSVSEWPPLAMAIFGQIVDDYQCFPERMHVCRIDYGDDLREYAEHCQQPVPEAVVVRLDGSEQGIEALLDLLAQMMARQHGADVAGPVQRTEPMLPNRLGNDTVLGKAPVRD